MGITERLEIVRRICAVLFLLDTSKSMGDKNGAPIGALNAAMEGIIKDLVSMNNDNSDVEIRIGILTFDSGVSWITGDKGLVDPADYQWKDIDAFGGTSMGGAFRKLNKALSVSENGFMNRASGSVAPVIFLLSDGEPTDSYKDNLDQLKENNWFKIAGKVAIGYGDSNDDVLSEFTGNTETVLHTNNPADLKKMIHFVTITSAMVASKGGNSHEKNKPDPDDMTSVIAGGIRTIPAYPDDMDSSEESKTENLSADKNKIED